ncbi:MAG: DUF4232 domain-containing protein [Nocardiopsaceae bacterium]|nr:DUF4232 domain-containing protein [Nocardiopsaceae bacterium]
MRFRASAAIAISVVTAGLCAAGCQSSTSAGASGPASGQPASAQTGSPPAGSPSPPAGSSTAPGQGAGQGPGEAGSGGKGTVSGATCQAAQLRVALGPNSPSAGNSMQRVDLTNTGPATCTMNGFPGVNLVGTVDGKAGYQWPLERSTSVSPAKVTLAPGDSAHFNIAYLAWTGDSNAEASSGREIKVSEIVITPPNDYAHTHVAWNQGVLLQDAATHSGTWIQPVEPGA